MREFIRLINYVLVLFVFDKVEKKGGGNLDYTISISSIKKKNKTTELELSIPYPLPIPVHKLPLLILFEPISLSQLAHPPYLITNYISPKPSLYPLILYFAFSNNITFSQSISPVPNHK